MNRKRLFLIAIGILFVVIIIQGGPGESNHLSSYTSIYQQYNTEFKSERGFGNDRFDVYSFSLNEPPSEQHFQVPDDAFEDVYKNFSDMIDVEMGSEQSELKEDIKRLSQENDLRVRYVHQKGTRELYLYSERLNKGYHMILTI